MNKGTMSDLNSHCCVTWNVFCSVHCPISASAKYERLQLKVRRFHNICLVIDPDSCVFLEIFKEAVLYTKREAEYHNMRLSTLSKGLSNPLLQNPKTLTCSRNHYYQ